MDTPLTTCSMGCVELVLSRRLVTIVSQDKPRAKR